MATLADVAAEAGLTVTTVSRVLNNRGYISEEAREKVRAAMAKLNYQPNEMARSLKKKYVNMVGLITPHISHPYFAKAISCLEKKAAEAGFRILLCSTQDSMDKMKEYIDLCICNRVAAVIVMSGNVTPDMVKNLHCPLITLESQLKGCTASIDCDNYQGGVLAARHLIEKGCKSLLQVGGTLPAIMPADERLTGFSDTCRQMEIPYHWVGTSREQFEDMSYSEMIEAALRRYPETDGIFCCSDIIATQAIRVCAKMNRSVPDEIRIVGFDDVDLANLVTPAITTIHQPIEEMMELAVSLMTKSFCGEALPEQTILPVRLVERETT